MEFPREFVEESAVLFEDVFTQTAAILERAKYITEAISKDIDYFFKNGVVRIPNHEKYSADFEAQQSDVKENLLPKSSDTSKRITRQVSKIIKTEKLSTDAAPNDAPNKPELSEMLPPTQLPARMRKIKAEPKTRSSRRTVKEEPVEVQLPSRKDSDVILQNAPVTLVDLVDDDTDESEKSSVANTTYTKPTRSTRTKKKDNSEEDAGELTDSSTRSTRTKTKKGNAEVDGSTRTTRTKKKKDNSEEKVMDSRDCSTTRTKKKKDNSEEDAGVLPDCSTRSTRTKTRALEKKAALLAMESEDETAGVPKSKISKLNPSVEKHKSNTEDEYALSNIDLMPNNATFVSQSNAQVNETVIVENPKILGHENMETALMTDDDSPIPIRQGTKSKTTKQVFSPFEKTPMKKKIEAFEKMNTLEKKASAIPKLKPSMDSKPKTHTPLFTSKIIPKFANSTSKVYKSHRDISVGSLSSSKSASAMKVSQAEFREREKQRQEKERQALKKREALLQAQTEERRRLREERELKVQMMREAKEKEKQQQLQKQEERRKQAEKEREEKLRQELERKRLASAKKHTANETKTIPKYMRQKAPLLPTNDCYDSDDEEYAEGISVRVPEWARDNVLKMALKTQAASGEILKNTTFGIQAQTPDLREIFESIEERKLKRTSSAQWKKPPRFTMMTSMCQLDECSESESE